MIRTDDIDPTLGVVPARLARWRADSAVARALVALADSYGLQVVVDEPGMNRESAKQEIVRIAASLLRVDLN